MSDHQTAMTDAAFSRLTDSIDIEALSFVDREKVIKILIMSIGQHDSVHDWCRDTLAAKNYSSVYKPRTYKEAKMS